MLAPMEPPKIYGTFRLYPGTREEEKQRLLEAEQLLLARPKVDPLADASLESPGEALDGFEWKIPWKMYIYI